MITEISGAGAARFFFTTTGEHSCISGKKSRRTSAPLSKRAEKKKNHE